jgi:hypothetical protein
MSKRDRKLAMGEKITPFDSMYDDPEGREYPDPLSEPDSFVQQLLQDINSARRNEEFETEDIDEFEGYLVDFLTTCSDPELGEEDLHGTSMIMNVLNQTDTNNGISTFGSVKKESIIPALAPLIALAPAAGGFGLGGAGAAAGAGATGVLSGLGAGLSKLLPFAAKGLAWEGGKNILGGLNPFNDEGGASAPPVQTMNTTAPGFVPQASADRSNMPFDHISDNLMFESASGIKKKDSDIESLRAQVNSALTQWAKSGDVVENRAVWWALYSYAHEAETIAELSSILTAVPEEYHNAVLNTPVGLEGEAPDEGNTGLPEPTSPTEALSPSNTSMSPIPIDGVGTPPKMPANQQTLIPGAVAASHDSLKVKPVFASLDESKFETYVEEDRPILARVAAFMEAGTHESDIVNTLYPSYGHEYTLWAVEQVKRVASNDPMVDPSIVNMGIDWKESANDPHDLPEGMHQMNIMEVLEDVKKEKKNKKQRENNEFPQKGERVGPNEDEQLNQQETSGMITPQQEKTAEFSLMNTELQHDEDALQVEPTLYLSRKLSYPFGLMAKMIQESGDFAQANQKSNEIYNFVEDYINNYIDGAIGNVMNVENVLNMLPQDVIARIPEENLDSAQRYIEDMAAQQREAVERLLDVARELTSATEMFANIMPQEILGNQEAMQRSLEEAGINPQEYNRGVEVLLSQIDDVTGLLVSPITGEPGFLPEDQDKAFRFFQETGQFADPRQILESPQDFELNERDREMMNQIGIDFPRESKKKESDFTSLPNSTLAETPAPYSQSYNQTMGMAQQFAQAGNPAMTQQAYQAGKDAAPDPGVFGQLQQQQEEEAQLQEMYPNVPTDMTRQWLQREQQQQQSAGHPMQNANRQSPAGQTATNTAQGLPSATTSKVAAWKDVRGDVLIKDRLYKMTSSDYEIPDYVRVVNNGTRLDLYIPRGDLDVSLSESEIKQSNYKFEPIEEDSQQKTSFLSESALSTNEQRALIEEKGVARNMDRLNLEGTHYPTLMQTSKNDKIDLEEVALEDFFIEDFDLFI